MKRFDYFQPIHNTIRVQLYETGALLQQSDFDLPREAETAVDNVKAVISLLESYQAFREKHTLPAVAAYEPAIADSLVQECTEAGRLREKLRALVNAFDVGSQQPRQDWSAGDLVTSFENLALFTIQHLRREENLASKLLWRYYSDAELQAIAAIMTGQPAFSSLPASGKRIVSDRPAHAKSKGQDRCLPNQNVFQSMAATAISTMYPQHRSLLQDVLAGGMI